MGVFKEAVVKRPWKAREYREKLKYIMGTVRAPATVKVSSSARQLDSIKPKLGSVIATVQENSMIPTVFHPELTITKNHKPLLELTQGKR
ncbi:hypothetical protein [Vulcanisaeta souniana]|nr:hypothetical protein [Vulcanisaeta souniana]